MEVNLKVVFQWTELHDRRPGIRVDVSSASTCQGGDVILPWKSSHYNGPAFFFEPVFLHFFWCFLCFVLFPSKGFIHFQTRMDENVGIPFFAEKISEYL